MAALFDNSIQQALASKSESVTLIRLGEVASLDSSGRAKVQFAGESAASNKTFTYIEGYIPEVGDKVALVPQGDTYVIIGAIVSGNPSDETPYVQKGSSEGVSKLKNGAHELELNASGDLVPNANAAMDLGSAAASMGNAYVQNLYINGTQVTPNQATRLRNSDGSYYVSIDVAGNMVLSGSDMYMAALARPWARAYISTLYLSNGSSSRQLSYNSIPATHIVHTSSSGASLEWGTQDSNPALHPASNQGATLGTSSYQFRRVYASQFYQSGTAISTSDRRKKKSIKALAKKYIDFFMKLRPVTYLMKDGESGRTHAGFIAQEVEEAMHEAGIENKDFAGLVIQEDGFYGLRYEEFIALQTQVIQNQQKQIDDLTARVEDLERRITNGI